MNIVFIYNTAHQLGGAMTLAARLTNWLVEHGHGVDIIIIEPESRSSNNVIGIFSKKAKFHFLDTKYRYLPWYPINYVKWAKETFHDSCIDVIVTLSKESLFIASVLYPAFKSNPIVTPYVINNVSFSNIFKSIKSRVIRNYFCKNIPDEYKMFMSNRVREMHEKSLGKKFKDSKVLLLPVKLKEPRSTNIPSLWKIVSIGRLDDFQKQYVFNLPEIVSNLRSKGLNVICEVYGNGNDNQVNKLMNEIDEHKVHDIFKYCGEVEYSKFHNVLRDCYLFVGMGTAAIEAAMYGIPVIVATAYSCIPKCYGYLCDLPSGVVGEDLETESALNTEELIIKTIQLNLREYTELSKKHIEYVRQYNIEELCPEMMEYFRMCLKHKMNIKKLSVFVVIMINIVKCFSSPLYRLTYMVNQFVKRM